MTLRSVALPGLFLATVLSAAAFAGDWPVLKTYEGECLRRVKLPLGGLGTGTISLARRTFLRLGRHLRQRRELLRQLRARLGQRGLLAEAERVVRDIRNRYDCRKRNPFDEAECGRHYARSLTAWSVLKDWGE